MAGPSSSHMVNSYDSSMASPAGNVSSDTNMHGTQGNLSFSLFSQSSLGFNEMSEATHFKLAELQAKLNQKLGPEFISQRPGGGGMRLTYAEGWKMINLANEVFGFNGWSTKVVNMVTDFIDASEGGGKFNICVTATVRVTLRDGVYHEDVGCGTIENIKSKAQGLDKCKKEAVTDAVKRALRNFGNLMGNCLYDKNYTQEVVKIKVPPAKFNQNELHRRPEFQEGSSTSKSTPASTPTTPHFNTTPAPSRPQYQPQQPPQPQRPSANQPPVKTEPTAAASALGPPSRVHMMNLPPNDSKGKLPQRAMQPPPPRAAPESTTDSRRAGYAREGGVATSVPASSSVTLGTGSSDPDPDPDPESFPGFSDDDALFASVNLDDLGPPIDEDVGRPIDEDADLGRPFIPEEPDESCLSATTFQEPAASHHTAKPSSSSRASRLEAIIAAGMPQSSSGQSTNNRPGGQRVSLGGSNENKDPNANQSVSSGHQGKSNEAFKTAAPSMGGFNFPPGVPNPLSASGGFGTGMKRPVDMISTGEQRGSRPGMGLHQAQQNGTNGRQILGQLHNGGPGDPKRPRR
ncbi:RAD52 DNA repair protein [Coprinopsis sp. MPI-PUGE-AT-0042]|nr:RAD52 DNA repair protein [Coprinopsis sp. MPI-PUGE-AT-0042]